MKTIVSLLLVGGAILTAGCLSDAVSKPSNYVTVEQAIKAVSILRIGMREADVERILTPSGLSPAGVMGTGVGGGETLCYNLSGGAGLALTFLGGEQVFGRTNRAACANDNLLSLARISLKDGTYKRVPLGLMSADGTKPTPVSRKALPPAQPPFRISGPPTLGLLMKLVRDMSGSQIKYDTPSLTDIQPPESFSITNRYKAGPTMVDEMLSDVLPSYGCSYYRDKSETNLYHIIKIKTDE